MAITYTQTDTAIHCSVVGADGETELVEGGPPGTTEQTVTVSGEAGGYVVLNEIDITSESSPNGSYTARLNVTTANMSMSWTHVRWDLNNNLCSSQGIDTDDHTDIGLDSTGVKSVTVSATAVPALSNGDRLKINYRIANSHMQPQSFGFTPDQDIDTPLTAGGETQITLAATAQGTAALTLTRPLRNITIDSTAQGTAALSVRKVLSSITLAANAVGTAALTRTANFFRDLSATAQGTATIARTTFIIRTLAATAQGTAALVKTVTFKRTLAATAQGTAALTKMMTLFRTLAATAQGTATLAANELAGVTQITIAAIAQGSAALTSRIALRHLDLAATAQATADLVRQVFFFRTLSAIAQGTANLTKQTLVVKILAAVAQGTANLTKQMTLFRPLSAIAQGTAALTKQMTLFRTLAATAQGTATLVSQKIFVITLAAVASVTAAVSTLITSVPIPFSGHGGLGMMDGLTRWSRRRRTWTRRR